MNRLRSSASILIASLGLAAAAPASSAPLSFQQRVEAQRAIEGVLWNHRIWPKDNPGPKPPLSSVVPEEYLRRKAEDAVLKSAALESLWKQPITPDQLQAEIDRIVKNSKDPGILLEMFAALGNDPTLIAETIARPLLADRLVRTWYGQDERYQGSVRRDVARRLETAPSLDALESLGGVVTEAVWRLEGADGQSAAPGEPGSIDIGPAEWEKLNESLRSRFGRPSGDRIPLGTFSRLREDDRELSIALVRESGPDRLSMVTVSWPKADFDAWWDGERGRLTLDVPLADQAPASGYSVPEAVASCLVDTWDQSRYGSPDPRADHTAIWTGSEMIVWGGVSWSSDNSGARYNPATDTWTQTGRGTNLPGPRSDHSAIWTGSEMIIWGGLAPTGPLNDGGRYNPVTDSWTPTSLTNAPAIRTRQVAVWTGTRMIIWGGEAGTGTRNTGGVYNPSTDTWTATSLTNAPPARTQLTAVWTGTVMVVWGGLDLAETNTGGRYNPTTDTWAATSVGAGVPTVRYRHTAIWTGSRMVVWGGISTFLRLNTGALYDPVADTWVATSTGANVPLGRASHTAIWTGSRMIIWGGTNGAGSLFSGGIFDPSTNSWPSATSLVNMPPERVDHTAVWTGTRMVIWGGFGAGDVVGAGGRYDPSTDSWTPVGTGAGTLSPRIGHASVWTGSEYVVWGGWDGVNLNSGGRYDPSTDTWTTMSQTNAPSPRLSAMSVWDGTRLLVWGGTTTPAFSYLATGGRYDVSTDSWSPISQAGNPSGRVFGGAVWSGSVMVIWGGRNSGTYFNTGGRYDPAMNTWQPTSTGGAAPSGRTVYNNAVWTGTEMIIWGGFDGGARVNTGARYSPFNDTWIVMATGAGTPSAREKNAAVWTGSQMMIFGGYSGTSTLNTGGRYTPGPNSWVPTATVAGPSARESAAMVWTGDRVLVWGGDNVSAALSTGGEYNPQLDSWTSLPNPNSPSPQNGPTAVWTGSQMLVLGGSSQVGLYCTCVNPQQYFLDQDGDGFGTTTTGGGSYCGGPPPGHSANSTDCNDANSSIWGKPGEVAALNLAFPSSLSWTSPTAGGTSGSMLYDTLRSGTPSNFNTSTTCIETDNGPNTTATDASNPAPGQLFAYLIRAQNACPSNNIGTLGFRSSGVERTGRTCP